ncbi:YciI family protein [Hamadaea sp. NPDC050747]|uniref:YciI family protein n=1 Tax=Hamadaea sp. NPDC050747 TaxID=3155789 RepID=UPI0033F35C38
MQYALLIFDAEEDLDRATRPVPGQVAAALDQPYVVGWARLHAAGSATTLRKSDGETLLTDGPFIDSKEFLAGLIVIEAENLDAALAIAHEFQATRTAGAIELRPIIQGRFGGA